MSRIHQTNLIDAPIEKVVAFARDPKHWHDWYVGLREPESITGDGGPGTIVKHHYQMVGVPFAVTSHIMELKEGPKETTHKLNFEGLLNGSQIFTYKAVGDKTEVTIDIDYVIPGSVLGRIADRLLVEHIQQKSMEHSLVNLKMLCEAEVHAAAATR